MSEQETIHIKANTIRAMATAICIAEYKLIQLKDKTHHQLKQRVNEAIKYCNRVEQYFIQHEDASPEIRQTFKREFVGDEIILLSEIMEMCFGLGESDLETILEALKKNISN